MNFASTLENVGDSAVLAFGGLLIGALFGFFAYATYDLTNQATLIVWSTRITLIDITWGTFITALGATVGGWVLRRMKA